MDSASPSPLPTDRVVAPAGATTASVLQRLDRMEQQLQLPELALG